MAKHLFFSYAQQDDALRDQLSKHLATLENQGAIDGWDERRVGAGEDWKAELDKHLASAKIILLLVSADFLASPSCNDIARRALQRHKGGSARLIPVLVRPCDWEGAPFSALQVLPRDGRAVTTWSNRDEAWLDVAQGIRAALDQRELFGAATRPEFPDETTEALSGRLAHTFRRKNSLRRAGIATTEIDAEIRELKRKLREGGQLRPGDALGDGRYLLLHRIGRGGFANVWEALDEQANRRVAVKVLHSELASDSVRRERFFRGARIMNALSHESIVKILEAHGEDTGFYYFVMELLAEGDLRHAILDRRFSRGQIVELILRVGEALEHAHARGFIHRDVKPANILLANDGAPKLTDFDLVAGGDTTGGTRTGAMGSFLYAAPEQMERPQDADRRADIYGLAMTAMFCLHGRDLSTHGVMKDTARSLAALRWDAMAGVLGRAIEWDPAARFDTMGDFCAALKSALDLHPPTQDVPGGQSTISILTAPVAVATEPPDAGGESLGASETTVPEAKEATSANDGAVAATKSGAGPEGRTSSKPTGASEPPLGLADLVSVAPETQGPTVTVEALGAPERQSAAVPRVETESVPESTPSLEKQPETPRAPTPHSSKESAEVEEMPRLPRELRTWPALALSLLIVLVMIFLWLGSAREGHRLVQARVICREGASESVAACQLACEDSDAASCVRFGEMLELGVDGIAKDEAKALALYRKACDAGNAEGCNDLGGMFEYGRGGVSADAAKAVPLYRKACSGGDARGCKNLGWMYNHGKGGLAVDDRKAVELYTMACNAGNLRGCVFLARMYDAGRGGLAEDEELAVELDQQTCDGGDLAGCAELGRDYWEGKGALGQDGSKAIGILEKTCERDGALGCVFLGDAKMSAEDDSADDAGRALFEKGCRLGEGLGCVRLGWLYDQGLGGVSKDTKKAAALFQIACDRGDPLGCNNLGALLDNTPGVVQFDQAKVISLFRLACDDGAPIGCANLGWYYETGRGVTKSERKATEFYQQAYLQGERTGLVRLAGMYVAGKGGVVRDEEKAASLYRKACVLDESRGCYGLASLYHHSKNPRVKDLVAAIRLYELACRLDEDLCVDLGWVHYNGEDGITRNDKKALELFQRACDAKVISGCTGLGVMFEYGRGVPEADPDRAVTYYQAACDGGNGLGCVNLALAYEGGRGRLQQNAAQAVAYFERACDIDASHCTYLGDRHKEGKDGLSPSIREAVRLYQRTCDGGDVNACITLGRWYRQGEGSLPKDERTAAELYQIACNAGREISCSDLGDMYRFGVGNLPKHEPKAAECYGKACEGGFNPDCNRAASMYEHGDGGVPKVAEKAAYFYKLSCNGGDIAGCSRIGWMHHTGEGGVAKDEAKAKELLQKGCKARVAWACEHLKEIGAAPRKEAL